MLNIRRTGNTIAEVIASVRDVPARVIPYAAATALTPTAKTAQAEVGTGMRTTFDRPTQYTLNATYTVVATKDKLSARVAVKDTAGTGVIPEHSVRGREAGVAHHAPEAVLGAFPVLDLEGADLGRQVFLRGEPAAFVATEGDAHEHWLIVPGTLGGPAAAAVSSKAFCRSGGCACTSGARPQPVYQRVSIGRQQSLVNVV